MFEGILVSHGFKCISQGIVENDLAWSDVDKFMLQL